MRSANPVSSPWPILLFRSSVRVLPYSEFIIPCIYQPLDTTGQTEYATRRIARRRTQDSSIPVSRLRHPGFGRLPVGRLTHPRRRLGVVWAFPEWWPDHLACPARVHPRLPPAPTTHVPPGYRRLCRGRATDGCAEDVPDRFRARGVTRRVCDDAGGSGWEEEV